MMSKRCVSALFLGLVLGMTGCDDGAKSDKEDAPAKKAEAKPKADETKADEKPEDEKEEAKAEEPPKPKVVACDQRDFIPEGDKKLAEQLGKEAKPKLACMDYSKKEGGFDPSCAQGTALETPCPDEDVVATCTMNNGTVFKHYKGADLSTAKRMCGTMEGTYATA